MTHNYQQLIIKFTSWGPAPAQCSALSPSALSSQLSTLVFLSQLCRVQRWRLLAPAPALSCIPGIILITSPVNVKLVFRKHVTPTIWSMESSRKKLMSGQIKVFLGHKQACKRHFYNYTAKPLKHVLCHMRQETIQFCPH